MRRQRPRSMSNAAAIPREDSRTIHTRLRKERPRMGWIHRRQ